MQGARCDRRDRMPNGMHGGPRWIGNLHLESERQLKCQDREQEAS
jgi:hypothetical protein